MLSFRRDMWRLVSGSTAWKEAAAPDGRRAEPVARHAPRTRRDAGAVPSGHEPDLLDVYRDRCRRLAQSSGVTPTSVARPLSTPGHPA